MKEIDGMRDFLEKEMGQLKAGQVNTDLIHQKLGQIEEQVLRLLDKVGLCFSVCVCVCVGLCFCNVVIMC